jgi:hypothetical protein
LGLAINIPLALVGIHVVPVGPAVLHVLHVIECLELRLELVEQCLLGHLLRLYLLNELLLLLLFRFYYFLRVVYFVDFAIHFIFIEVILRWIRITTHGLITALVVRLITLFDFHNLVRTLKLIFLEEVAPLKPNWILSQLAKHTRLATGHIPCALNTNLSNGRV